MKNRILNYLSNGVKPADVATIVGCTPAYISQLLSQDDFKEELHAKLSDQKEDAGETQLDTKYETMEHKLLKAMEVSLVDAELPAITRALEVVAKRQELAKSRKNPIPLSSNGVSITMVSLTLPSQAMRQHAPAVTLNSQQEVIAIEGQSLASMASESVKTMFQTLKSREEIKHVVNNAIEAPTY